MTNLEKMLGFLETILSYLSSDESIVTVLFGLFVLLVMASVQDSIILGLLSTASLLFIYSIYMFDKDDD